MHGFQGFAADGGWALVTRAQAEDVGAGAGVHVRWLELFSQLLFPQWHEKQAHELSKDGAGVVN